MKIDKKPNLEISLGTDGEDSNFFSFDQSNLAHIFEMLRDAYSDKILAVIREYSTNAFDAHVEAGKRDVPISVHIPTLEEPFFSVRDYGFGLSEEKILRLYTSYGASSKNSSNDFNGMLGIGSKSAFCYAKSFTVISRHGGIKKEFLCFIDETNLGKITKISEEECGANDTGLEIRVECSRDDIPSGKGSFFDKCLEFYTTFEVRPNFNVDMKFPKCVFSESFNFQYEVNGVLEDFEIKLKRYENFDCNGILMGNVVYSIPSGIQSVGRAVFVPMVLEVPIGAIKFANSREQISLDKKTTKFLDALFPFLRDKFESHIQQKINECTNILDAAFLFSIFEKSIAENFVAKISYKLSKDEIYFDKVFGHFGAKYVKKSENENTSSDDSNVEVEATIDNLGSFQIRPINGLCSKTSVFFNNASSASSPKRLYPKFDMVVGSKVFFAYRGNKSRVKDLLLSSTKKFKDIPFFRYSSDSFFNFYRVELNRCYESLKNLKYGIESIEKDGIKPKDDNELSRLLEGVDSINKKISGLLEQRDKFDKYVDNTIKNLKVVSPIFDNDIVDRVVKEKVSHVFSVRFQDGKRKKYKLDEILSLPDNKKCNVIALDTDSDGQYAIIFGKKFYSHEKNNYIFNFIDWEFHYAISKENADKYGITNYATLEQALIKTFIVNAIYKDRNLKKFSPLNYSLTNYVFNRYDSELKSGSNIDHLNLLKLFRFDFFRKNISHSNILVKQIIEKSNLENGVADDVVSQLKLINSLDISDLSTTSYYNAIKDSSVIIFGFNFLGTSTESEICDYLDLVQTAANDHFYTCESKIKSDSSNKNQADSLSVISCKSSKFSEYISFFKSIAKYLNFAKSEYNAYSIPYLDCVKVLSEIGGFEKYDKIFGEIYKKVVKLEEIDNYSWKEDIASSAFELAKDSIIFSDGDVMVVDGFKKYLKSEEFKNNLFNFLEAGSSNGRSDEDSRTSSAKSLTEC